MSKKPRKSVSIRVHKDGSMTLRSTGGVDLRKVVPQLFKTDEPEASSPPPAEREESPQPTTKGRE